MAITAEQRRIRKNYIGSSDMAALFGLDPYGRNSHDLYLEKTGQLPERVVTKAMQLGTRLEGYVLDWAEAGDDDWEGIGELNRHFGSRIRASDHLAAHVDAATSRDAVPVEAKTHWFGQTAGEWGEDGTDQVPDHIKIQLHTQMLCLGADLGWVVALLGQGLSHFLVPREEAVCELVRETAKRFWEEHVMPRIPPPDVLPNLESLKVLRRESKKRIALDPCRLATWQYWKEERTLTEEKLNGFKAALLAAMGDAEEAVFGEGEETMITYYEQSRRDVDAKKLFADHPDLRAKYETTTTHRVLREKKV